MTVLDWVKNSADIVVMVGVGIGVMSRVNTKVIQIRTDSYQETIDALKNQIEATKTVVTENQKKIDRLESLLSAVDQTCLIEGCLRRNALYTFTKSEEQTGKKRKK